MGLRFRIRIVRLVRRYPETTFFVLVWLAAAMLCGLMLLWRWTLFVFVGAFLAVTFVVAFRQDRRRARKRAEGG